MFDIYLYVLGTRFHLYTALLIGVTVLGAWLLLGRVNPLVRLMSVMALGCFVIHLYEVAHAAAEWVFTGVTGGSVWMLNVPVAFLSLIVLHRLVALKPSLVSVFFGVLGLGVTLMIMGYQGFFRTLNYDVVWASSKVMASLVGLSLVRRHE